MAPLAVNLVGLRRDLYLGRIKSDTMFPQWAISVESFFPLTHIFRGCALAVDVSEHAGFMYVLLSARFSWILIDVYLQVVRCKPLVVFVYHTDFDSVSVFTRTSVVTADVMVVAVTWIRLRGQVKEASGLVSTVSSAMLVDGEHPLDSYPDIIN